MRGLGPLALMLAVASRPAAAEPERFNVEGLGRLPAFSHGAVAGDLIFASGTLGTRPGGTRLVPGGIEAQTAQALANLEAILGARGADRRHVAKCTVFLADMADYAGMNRAWIAFFGDTPPARSTIAAAGLAVGAAIEVECLAERPARRSRVDLERTYTSGFVPRGADRLYYETAGEGEAVVLCHGYGGNHAVWFQQLPALAERHRVITWDQRGFGRSSDRSGSAGPEAAAGDLAALLDHLGVERAHLVGQSMGGWAVTGFARAQPGRVRSLVLADTPGGLWTQALAAHFDGLLAAGGGAAEADAVPMLQHPALAPGLARRDPARAFLYRQLTSLGPPAPLAIPILLRETRHPLDALAGLDAPLLFLVGDGDAIFPPALIRELAARLPGAQTLEIAGAGHSPYFEQPESWNRAVLEFLSGVR